jgi:hypothetical protein
VNLRGKVPPVPKLVDTTIFNALERRAPASSLVLKVKASDLAEFREGKIKKEEVRGRIQSRSF